MVEPASLAFLDLPDRSALDAALVYGLALAASFSFLIFPDLALIDRSETAASFSSSSMIFGMLSNFEKPISDVFCVFIFSGFVSWMLAEAALFCETSNPVMGTSEMEDPEDL